MIIRGMMTIQYIHQRRPVTSLCCHTTVNTRHKSVAGPTAALAVHSQIRMRHLWVGFLQNKCRHKRIQTQMKQRQLRLQLR